METGLYQSNQSWMDIVKGALLTRQHLVDALDPRQSAERMSGLYQGLYQEAYRTAVKVRAGETSKPVDMNPLQEFFYKACEGSRFMPARKFTPEQVDLLSEISARVSLTDKISYKPGGIDKALYQIAEADPSGRIKIFYPKVYRYADHTYESLLEELGDNSIDLFIQADAINYLVLQYNDMLLQYAGERLVVV